MKHQQGLLPSNFKIIGGLISVSFLCYAFVHHFVEPNLLFEGLRVPNLFFCFGLILIIASKEEIDDEYADQVRLYAHSMTSVFFIIFIFMEEIDGEKYSMLSELTGILLIYLLVYYYSFNRGFYLVKKPRAKVQFFWFLIFVAVLASQHFLWSV